MIQVFIHIALEEPFQFVRRLCADVEMHFFLRSVNDDIGECFAVLDLHLLSEVRMGQLRPYGDLGDGLQYQVAGFSGIFMGKAPDTGGKASRFEVHVPPPQ